MTTEGRSRASLFLGNVLACTAYLIFIIADNTTGILVSSIMGILAIGALGYGFYNWIGHETN